MEQAKIPGLEAGLGGREGRDWYQDSEILLEVFDQGFHTLDNM